MQTTTKSPSLTQHQEALARIYKMDSLAELNDAPKMLKEYTHLKPNQIEALLNVIKRQKDVIQETAPAPTRTTQLAEEYKEIDKENFGPTEVKITSTGLPNEYKQVTISQPVPLADAVAEVVTVFPDKPKRQKKVSTAELVEEVQTIPPTPVIKEVTVSRRVNLPIEGVQYSNNEFNVTVTATNKDDAVNELNTLLESFLADQGLFRKSVHDKMIADLRSSLSEPKISKNESDKLPIKDDKIAKQYERLKALMNYVYQNSSNKEEMTRLREEFTKSNPIIQ